MNNKAKAIQIFNQEVSNCDECNFFNQVHSHCNITGSYNHDSDTDILNDCPFAKPLTKEDIETFGFEYDDGNDTYHSTNKIMFNYIIDYYNDSQRLIVDDTKSILFNGIITSKPHLEFILKTLNII